MEFDLERFCDQYSEHFFGESYSEHFSERFFLERYLEHSWGAAQERFLEHYLINFDIGHL